MHPMTSDQMRWRLSIARVKAQLIGVGVDASAVAPDLSMLERLRLHREIRGWASRADVRDRVKDVVEALAFSRAKAIYGQYTRSTALHLNHDEGPIGQIIYYGESSKGLYIHAVLSRTELANLAYLEVERSLMAGELPGLSIGMDRYSAERRQGTRYLSAVLLGEISLILRPKTPANPLCLLGPP